MRIIGILFFVNALAFFAFAVVLPHLVMFYISLLLGVICVVMGLVSFLSGRRSNHVYQRF